MTATYEPLTVRAESAVLGALLIRPDVYTDVAYLDPEQFADPANAALFDAVRTELVREPNQTSSSLTAHLQAAYATTGVDPDLDRFIDACPDPGGAAVYARMLVEADLNRTMARHAVRLAETSEPNSPARVEAFVLMRSEPAMSRDAEEAPVSGSWKGSRSSREERILADLVQHPDQIEQASEAINTATFTADSRSDLFEALSRIHKRGEPVDNLTVAWELDRIQTSSFRDTGVDPSGYVDRLTAVPVEPGIAVETARQIASQEQRVAERQARAQQSAGPTHGGTGRAVNHQVSQHRHREAEVRPPSYDPPSPGIEPRGPQIGR